MTQPGRPRSLRAHRVVAAAVGLLVGSSLLDGSVTARSWVADASPPTDASAPSPVAPDAALRTDTLASASVPATSPTATSPTATAVEMPTFRLAPIRPTFRLAPLGPPQPVEVRIPAIDVRSDLVELGLQADRSIEVPSEPQRAGWFSHRAVPGEQGAGVIVGHVDSHTGPAVFFSLRSLDIDDHVTVLRDDGSVAVFVITSVESHAKDRFPTRRVYGPTDGHELRLVTCGGPFDDRQRSYEENVVVFADLVAVR